MDARLGVFPAKFAASFRLNLSSIAVPRMIEPISKVELHIEDCDASVMLYEPNETPS